MPTTSIEFHSQAKQSFDKRACDFAKLIERFETKRSEGKRTPQSDSDPYAPHSVAEFNESNIIGPMRNRSTLRNGELTALQLIAGDVRISLQSHCLSDFTSFGDSVWRSAGVADYVNREFIDSAFMDWCLVGAKGSFVEFLVESIERETVDALILIPLNRVILRHRLTLMGCTLRPVSKSEVDQWLDGAINEQESHQIRTLAQGQCVVEVRVTAEPNYGAEVALRHARLICDVLAYYSPAMLVSGHRFNGFPIGQERTPRHTALVFPESAKTPVLVQRFSSVSDLDEFVLSENALNKMDKLGVKELSELFAVAPETDFKTRLRNSFSIHFKAAHTTDDSEKLAFTMIALEATFLRNDSESITQNISERIAYLLENSLEERKKCIETIKAAYKMRSKYFHHGQSASDTTTLNDFYIIAFLAMIRALIRQNDFDTKDEFIASIDDRKLSGA